MKNNSRLDGQLCLSRYQPSDRDLVIQKLCGEAAVCLGPTQVSCNAGFSWPP